MWVKALLFALTYLGFALRPANAQISDPTSQTPPPTPHISSPVFWAEVTSAPLDARQLDAYAACGLNTLVIHLKWEAGQNEAVGMDDFSDEKRLAQAADARGLRVIFGIPAAPQGMERALRLSGQSRAYLGLWQAWMAHAVQTLRPTPNLLGWMLPNDPRALPFDDNAAFSRWITTNYGGVEVLNRQWGAQFAALEEVSIESSDALIAAWKNAVLQDNTRNLAFHPAALALARFRLEAYQELMRAWASSLRQTDSDARHLIFSGRLPDYAQLLALPPEVDVSVPDIRPGTAEKDLLSHNPQAVSIARRGGRFQAIPVLETQANDAVSGDQLPRLMPGWAEAALSRGAAGLAFSSWPALMRNPALLRVVQNTLARLKNPPYSRVWNQTPASTSAVVLTPLADGHTLQTDPNAVLPPRGLYGFGTDMVSGEPSNLVWVLRWGTAFGSVDFLSSDDIAATDELPAPSKPLAPDFLSRYNTLLLPQALSVSPAMARALTHYVEGGGVVMSDLGLGASQVGGDASSLPPEMQTLFGVSPFPGLGVRPLRGNFGFVESHPLLPTWEAAANGRAGATLTAGDGPGGVAFSGLAAFFEPTRNARTSRSSRDDDTTALAVAQRVVIPGNPVLGTSDVVARSLLTIHDLGQGHALFAPVRLWNFWRPGLPGFDGLHGDLFARDAHIAVAGATSLVPSPRADNAYAEVVNFPNAVALLNHDARNENVAAPATTVLQTAGAIVNADKDARGADADFLWDNVLCALPTNGAELVDSARPSPLSPIADNAATTGKARPVTLYAITKPGLTLTHLLPLSAKNESGGALIAQVNQHDEKGVRVTLWPNATQVASAPEALLGGNFNVEADEIGASVRLQLWNDPDGFRIRPGSRHLVSVTDLTMLPPSNAGANSNPRRNAAPAASNSNARIQTFPAVADNAGCLIFEVTGRALLIEIAPAS